MTPEHCIRFDDWTLDARAGELMRGVERLRLQDQPLQVLRALLERPGELVTREELVARLWPRGVVDFETGLNTAVRRLRSALSDDADTPRYIETVPRRGYRFIGRISPGVRREGDCTVCIGAAEHDDARRDCLVVVHAPQLADIGRRHALHGDVARIGRDAENEVVVNSPGVSRRHARLERHTDATHIIDEGSTNGVLLNDASRPVAEAPLACGDELLLGDVVLVYLSAADLDAQHRALMHACARADGLTGLATRAVFDELLETEQLRARRHNRPLSLQLIDVDEMQNVVDRHGPLAGVALLRGVAKLIRRRLRPHDAACRWTADTLGVLLPETSTTGAAHMAESLRALVANSVFAAGRRELRTTISVGATSLEDALDAEELAAAASAALHAEIRSGVAARNAKRK